MASSRQIGLVLICAALVGLVWLDNRPSGTAEDGVDAPTPPVAATPDEPAAEGGPPPEPVTAPVAPPVEEEAQTGDPPRDSDAADENAAEPAEADTGSDPATAEPQSGNPLASLDKATLSDWVGRPLFAPSRKRPPNADPAAAPQADAAPPPTFELLGVVRDKDRATALLRKKSDGASFRVQVGDMLSGWRISKVDSRSVILLRSDGTSETISLFDE